MTEPRHLLSMEDLEPAQIRSLLDDAESIRSAGRVRPVLRGRMIVNLFYEASTRTRVSFEIAAKRLGADVVNVTSSASSIQKGESLRDTALTLRAMGVDAIVLRHPSPGAALRLSQELDCSVINAGDGAHQHPTQALLDLFSVRRRLGRLDGLKVAICGDISHSRVARSVDAAFRLMGSDVVLVAPPTMLPLVASGLACRTALRLDDELADLDVLYLLRLQKERHNEGLVASEGEFASLYGLTARRLAALPDRCVVMHPGPMNRGLEIDSEGADGGRSLVLDQVASGIWVRMAVLQKLLGEAA